MIIGKGMVAGALKELTGWDEDVLFSAGVSNSGETDLKIFQKETDLLKNSLEKINSPATIVYFSTISIFDPAKSGNAYIRHKLFIEEMIRNSGVNYLILRLPNLVGKSPNPNTLTNYFADSIRMGRKINLSQNAVRHLIDVDDLSSILNDIKSRFGKINLTVNVETGMPISASHILSILEEVIKKKAYIQPINEEPVKFILDNSLINSSLNYIWKTDEEYYRNLLKKYYSA